MAANRHALHDEFSSLLDAIKYGIGQKAWIWQNTREDQSFHALATATVPIPAAAWLLGSGILGLAGIRIRSRKKS